MVLEKINERRGREGERKGNAAGLTTTASTTSLVFPEATAKFSPALLGFVPVFSSYFFQLSTMISSRRTDVHGQVSRPSFDRQFQVVKFC
jgi:hypothetical protein